MTIRHLILSGARAARIVRFVRLLQFGRATQLIEYIEVKLFGKEPATRDETEDTGQSNLGLKMSDLTNKRYDGKCFSCYGDKSFLIIHIFRVILLVLCQLIVLSIFNADRKDRTLTIATGLIHQLAIEARIDPNEYYVRLFSIIY
jgi:hypothetical protein